MLVFDWIDAHVYLIPGGDPDSLVAYTGITTFMEEHKDLGLSVFRGPHPRDRQRWFLILVGEKTSMARYRHYLDRMLSQVQAQPFGVSLEEIAPYVEQFLARQREMLLTGQTFLERHTPLSPSRSHAKKKQQDRRHHKRNRK
ncbi:hypothetical protein KSF_087010 [Reticulibacter mediterranei]|uniref:Uncharacterized protein n=1 Tax=Reticulibacter mediterranei TaxID=2778369 RepID=A0A8J3IU76_9CHLR|nr:hypothetical protein [Reticulibacter mediterranei]GHO98653.1 hypothetical protein KSF_087010 [Reticulibacter mediterranei]